MGSGSNNPNFVRSKALFMAGLFLYVFSRVNHTGYLHRFIEHLRLMGLDARRLNGTLVDVAVYPPQESVYLMGHENEGSAALL